MIPADVPSGFIDVTPGAMSDAQRNAILAREARHEGNAITARHDEDQTHLYQLALHQADGSGILTYVFDLLEGTAQPFIAYTDSGLFGLTIHNGVGTPMPALSEGSHVIRYEWTVPDAPDPVAIMVMPTNLRDPVTGGIRPELGFGVLNPAGPSTVEVLFNLNVSASRITGEITMNGQHMANLDVPGGIPEFIPLFRRPRSGEYRLKMTCDGEVLVDEAYVQRDLVWEHPWPTIETTDTETPITFSNRLLWEVAGNTLPVDADQPRWRAQFPGAIFPPAVNGQRPYQSGSTVTLTWNPKELQLSGRSLDERSGIRLVPSDGEQEYSSAEAYQQSIQSRTAQTTFPYHVEGEAVSFDRITPVVRKRVNASGLVPARVRQVYVDNPRFEPDPPVADEPLHFKADVVSFFFDEPQIRWTLNIVNQETGEQRTFAQPEWLDFTDSFNLDVVWDRASDSGEPMEPGTYRGTFSVLVREKTKVGPNGGEIAVLAENSADQASKRH